MTREPPRLLLRRFVSADVPRIRALNAEPSTARWLPSHVYADAQEAQAAIDFLVSQYVVPGDPRVGPYVLAVEERATGRLLGHVGFSAFAGEVEISYAIAEEARGRGYGIDLVQQACAFAMQSFGLRRLIAITAADNEASCRTLVRAGFVLSRQETMDFQGMPRQLVRRYVWSAP